MAWEKGYDIKELVDLVDRGMLSFETVAGIIGCGAAAEDPEEVIEEIIRTARKLKNMRIREK